MLKGKGRIDKEPIDLAPATVEAISDWLGIIFLPITLGVLLVDAFFWYTKLGQFRASFG